MPCFEHNWASGHVYPHLCTHINLLTDFIEAHAIEAKTISVACFLKLNTSLAEYV